MSENTHIHDETEAESEAESQEVEVRHLQRQNLFFENKSFMINPTQALKFMGIDSDSYGDYSLEYAPREYDSLGFIPAFVDPSEQQMPGAQDNNIRSIVRTKSGNGVTSRCRVPREVVEKLGFDYDDKENKLVDVWVSDRVIFITNIEEQEFAADVPPHVSAVKPDDLEE